MLRWAGAPLLQRSMTLINRLLGDGALETREVSHTGEGRHTTIRRQLIVLEQGGMLSDMPGMRELGMLGAREGIEETYSDISVLARSCRYPDCRHDSELGSEVRAAIARRRRPRLGQDPLDLRAR